jgi:hypothetical protein
MFQNIILAPVKHFFFVAVMFYWGTHGSVVVKALCYKPEVRDPMRRIIFFFSIYLNIPTALGPGVYSASNRNEYQKQKNNVTGE